MAKTVQIRNVPDEVHRELKVRAAAAGQSLSDYLLEHAVQVASRPTVAEVLQRAGRRSGGTRLSTEEIVAAIKAGRGE